MKLNLVIWLGKLRLELIDFLNKTQIAFIKKASCYCVFSFLWLAKKPFEECVCLYVGDLNRKY